MAATSRAEAVVAGTWHDIVVVGGSAGALEPMLQLVQRLPGDYRGTVLIVSHIGAHPSHLPQLLDEVSRLPVRRARHEEAILRGYIYVASRPPSIDGRPKAPLELAAARTFHPPGRRSAVP